MRNARPYRRHRRTAPPCAEFIVGRKAGDSFAEIARSYGCQERTVRLALDRYVDRGEVPLVAVHVLHPHDGVARARLFDRSRAAHQRGVPVKGWETVEEARRRFGDGSMGYMP
ncbi:helix-turn-helix domain-containing protein [Siccirubricoccus sp. G192]|uniref:helix-turn-helix domain-containing protein n=1 Tax=Siccirubricoccus sp. G192 TaxID=2849651 RepID=UPI001C2B812F|nr:hypothetical protein [Siccirubricoccus sp. G192]MBV1800337.1 hypothetical protein [Siccirubricoccus sp. G192]MBV1800559.1 hypothetical protein [Siccirubricoccus sp. G192]